MSEASAIRRCANRCFFCFVEGLPTGLRQSLYVKDDDLLHSFLFGNFVTLTNLRQADWDRLQAQRLSPLYVSVHATDPELRRRMLGNPKAPDIMNQIRRLGQMRIQVHAQIVLCAGVNDGTYLNETIADLASLSPTVQSVGVVPVGATKHTLERTDNAVSRPSAQEAAEIIRQLVVYQRQFRRDTGRRFVYAADELYLCAGLPIPSVNQYDDFPQLSNGIGMTRKFLEEWRRIKRRLSTKDSPVRTLDRRRKVLVVTGTLFAPTLSAIIDDLNNLGLARFELVPVTNHFFGPTVTVSGLLTGADVLAALRGEPNIAESHLVFIPRNMLDADEGRFLDGLTPADLSNELRTPVLHAKGLGDMVSILKRLAKERFGQLAGKQPSR